MADIAGVIRDEICRLARREIRRQMAVTVKASAQHRRDIAELKRQIHELRTALSFLERMKCRTRRTSGWSTPTRQ